MLADLAVHIMSLSHYGAFHLQQFLFMVMRDPHQELDAVLLYMKSTVIASHGMPIHVLH